MINIVDYLTWVSGITPQLIENNKYLYEIKKNVQ